MAVAEILFLNNKKGYGYEDPFDLRSPLQSLLDFDQLLLPRKAGIKKDQAPSEAKGKELRAGKGKQDERTPPVRPWEAASGALEKQLDGRRGAGFEDIMALGRTESQRKDMFESVPTKLWRDLFPKYEVGELVLHYDRHGGTWKW